jgi:hypothetical protein
MSWADVPVASFSSLAFAAHSIDPEIKVNILVAALILGLKWEKLRNS